MPFSHGLHMADRFTSPLGIIPGQTRTNLVPGHKDGAFELPKQAEAQAREPAAPAAPPKPPLMGTVARREDTESTNLASRYPDWLAGRIEQLKEEYNTVYA